MVVVTGKGQCTLIWDFWVESYSCTVPNILVPRDVRGQRSHTGGLEWGREGSSHSEDMFGLAQQDLNFF